MDEIRPNFSSENYNDASSFKQILDRHANETISDYDVRRLLAPIQGMIDEGKFDKPKLFSWWPQTLVMLAAVVTLAIVVTLSGGGVAQDVVQVGTFVEINNARIPLAGTPLPPDAANYVLSEFAIMPILSVENINFRLINVTSQEEIDMPTMEFGDGYVFTFYGVLDGSYQIQALFDNEAGAQRAEVGKVHIVDGRVELIIEEGLETILN